MKNLIKKTVTRKNAVWFAKTNLQSWLLQGAVIGVLTLAGFGTVIAVVSAKAAAYAVFAGQCIKAYRG